MPRCLSSLVLCGSALCVFAHTAAAVQLKLLPQATASARTITVGDIAEVSGGADAALYSLRARPLAAAPLPGYTLRLTRREVQRLLSGAGSVTLVGAEVVTVSAVAPMFSGERVVAVALEALRSALQRDGRVLELTLGEPLPVLQLPRGAVTVRARKLASNRIAPRMVIWTELLLDGTFYRAVPVVVNVSVTEPVYVARAALGKGQVLDCTGLDVERRDVALLPAAPQATDCPAAPQRLRRNLAPGDVVLAAELEAIPDVGEGDVIKLEVMQGAVTLETDATALTNGRIGQRIAVRAASSHETLQALVVAPGVVQVSER